MIKIFACLLIACFALTSSEKHPRIVFGRTLTAREFQKNFQFMLLVKICGRDFTGRSVCGYCSGTLVKPDRALVAAHCFCSRGRPKTVGSSGITVYGGINKKGWKKRFLNTNGYPSYSSHTIRKGFRVTNQAPVYPCQGNIYRARKDVALIGLYNAIQFPTAPLLCGEKAVVGEKIYLLGYGFTEKKTRGDLMIAYGRMASCPSHLADHTIYCMDSGPNKPAFASGDSGGPLLVVRNRRFVQIGVAHGKTAPIRGHFKDVWASVSPYCHWIKTAQNSGPQPVVGLTEVVILSIIAITILNF